MAAPFSMALAENRSSAVVAVGLLAPMTISLIELQLRNKALLSTNISVSYEAALSNNPMLFHLEWTMQSLILTNSRQKGFISYLASGSALVIVESRLHIDLPSPKMYCTVSSLTFVSFKYVPMNRSSFVWQI